MNIICVMFIVKNALQKKCSLLENNRA